MEFTGNFVAKEWEGILVERESRILAFRCVPEADMYLICSFVNWVRDVQGSEYKRRKD